MPAAIELASPALGRFGLLASGIAGRSLDVMPAAPGERPWTDGMTVFLDDRASALGQVAALAVQASLIAAGSLEPGVARRLAGRPMLTRRYLAVEGHRALAHPRDAARAAVAGPLTDDPLVTAGITEMIDAYLADGQA